MVKEPYRRKARFYAMRSLEDISSGESFYTREGILQVFGEPFNLGRSPARDLYGG
jgi:hypothetical protein